MDGNAFSYRFQAQNGGFENHPTEQIRVLPALRRCRVVPVVAKCETGDGVDIERFVHQASHMIATLFRARIPISDHGDGLISEFADDYPGIIPSLIRQDGPACEQSQDRGRREPPAQA